MLKRTKTRPLSVLFFSHSPNLNGAERSLIELVDELVADRNVSCTVVSPGYGPLVHAMEAAGASTLVEPNLGLWAFSKGTAALSLTREAMAIGSDALLRIMPSLQALNPDVVYTQTITMPWGAAAAALLDKPHVWSICEFGDADLAFLDPFHETIEQIKSGASFILCASEAIRSALFPDLNRDSVRTVYRHISMPSESIKPCVKPFPGTADTRLAVFGTLQENKGQLDAIQATERLIARGRNVELLLAGHGSSPEYRAKLEICIAENKLSERVRISEFLPDPYPVMLAADIILVCSRSEAFGRVAAEGMLLGRPVIYPKNSGIREYMHDGVTGLSYSPGDIEELVNRIELLLSDPERAARVGAEAKGHATAKLTRDAYGGEVFQILKRLRRSGHRRVALPRQVVSSMTAGAVRLKDELTATRQQGEDLARQLAAHSADLIRLDDDLRAAKRQSEDLATALEARSADLIRLGDELTFAKRQREDLATALTARSAEVLETSVQSAKRDAELAHSHGRIRELTGILEERSREMRSMRASTSWRVTRPLRDARRLLGRICYSRVGYPLTAALRVLMTCSLSPLRDWHAVNTLRRSRLFDKEWYLNNNPDVAVSGIDPIRHYVNFGAREGRDPSPILSDPDYPARDSDMAAVEGSFRWAALRATLDEITTTKNQRSSDQVNVRFVSKVLPPDTGLRRRRERG
jgi:glycosyltransferase involved in cell wall biosynthesis